MFLSVFKGCLECHQSSHKSWNSKKKIQIPNKHFYVEKGGTDEENATEELGRTLLKDFFLRLLNTI